MAGQGDLFDGVRRAAGHGRPRRDRAAEPGAPDAADQPWTVSRLTAAIRRRLESDFPRVTVVGEISNFTHARSGHMYFSLKDEDAALGCVCWRSTAGRLSWTPEDGAEVRARGRITVYEPQGRYQLVVDAMEPTGAGALQAAFEELKRKLAADGLFDRERKRELPTFPRAVAVVTSPTGAAVRDMLRVLARRWPAARRLLVPVRVQGDGAAGEVAAALDLLGREAGARGIDVILCGRGGGSLEDLWAFNEEVVARAIAACPVPVISAVGHETDVTIADFVADVRAATPTEAAELAVPDRRELVERVEGLGAVLADSVHRRVTERATTVRGLARLLHAHSPRHRVRTGLQRADELDTRLARAVRGRVREARTRAAAAARRLGPAARRHVESVRTTLDTLGGRLRDLGPPAVLERGYAVALDRNGRPLTDAADLSPGDGVTVRLRRGTFDADVTDVSDGSDTDPDAGGE